VAVVLAGTSGRGGGWGEGQNGEEDEGDRFPSPWTAVAYGGGSTAAAESEGKSLASSVRQ
jgi:hypothetical protein